MRVKKIVTYVSPDADASASAKQACQNIEAEFNTLTSMQELFPLLSDTKYATDLVLIDIEKFYATEGANMFDIINALSTLINCTVCRRSPGKPTKRTTVIAAAVDITTDPKLIKEMLSTEIKGIYPRGTSFSLEEKRSAIEELLEGQGHVPAKISLLFKKKIVKTPPTNKIVLTPRQEQIANLVSTRGASNKVIARILNISESTVKLHMGAILKKYGVKNRTQLAVFSKESNTPH
jgi:hypothetical protein